MRQLWRQDSFKAVSLSNQGRLLIPNKGKLSILSQGKQPIPNKGKLLILSQGRQPIPSQGKLLITSQGKQPIPSQGKLLIPSQGKLPTWWFLVLVVLAGAIRVGRELLLADHDALPRRATRQWQLQAAGLSVEKKQYIMSIEQLMYRPTLEMMSNALTKVGNSHNITTHIIWANQKTEVFVYRWLCAHTLFDVRTCNGWHNMLSPHLSDHRQNAWKYIRCSAKCKGSKLLCLKWYKSNQSSDWPTKPVCMT